MRIGRYVDGRDLTYDQAQMQFAVGGTPVTLEQVLGYDAFGQIEWSSCETRDWALGLQAWMSAQAPAAAVCCPDNVNLPKGERVLRAATHLDGRLLEYDTATRLFKLGDCPIAANDVAALDTGRKLAWTRLDVQHVMQKAVRRGVPMGELPVPKDRPGRDRMVRVLQNVGTVASEMGAASAHGKSSSAMVCPHCQTKGSVRVRSITQKKGISGGKATAAVLTGGLSMLATGLSRKEQGTEAHCSNCGSTWRF